MKRWLSALLCIWSCMIPVICCAASSTEEIAARFFEKLVSQLIEPDISVQMHAPDETHMYVSLMESEDSGLGLQMMVSKAERHMMVRELLANIGFELDGDGVRMSSGLADVGVTSATLLRALMTNEDGTCFLPDLRNEDGQLILQITNELWQATTSSMTVATKESYIRSLDPKQADTVILHTMREIDCVKLLSALDTAISGVFSQRGQAIDDLLARNAPVLCEWLGISSVPTTAQMKSLWQKMQVSNLLSGDVKIIHERQQTEEAHIQDVISVLSDGMTVANAAMTKDRLSGYFGAEQAYAFDTQDMLVPIKVLYDAASNLSEDALRLEWSCSASKLHINLKFDAALFAKELVDGMQYALVQNRQEIERVIERYTPWHELFDEECLTWNMLYRAVSGRRAEIERTLQKWMKGLFVIRDGEKKIDRGSHVAIEADIRRNSVGISSVQIQAVMEGRSLDVSYDGQDFSARLRYRDENGKYGESRIDGFTSGNQFYAAMTEYTPEKKITTYLTLEGEKLESGWTYRLFDHQRKEICSMMMGGGKLALRADDMNLDATLMDDGVKIYGIAEECPFALDIVVGNQRFKVFGYCREASLDAEATWSFFDKYIRISALPAGWNHPHVIEMHEERKGLDKTYSLKAARMMDGKIIEGVTFEMLESDGALESLQAMYNMFGDKHELEYKKGMLRLSWPSADTVSRTALTITDLSKKDDVRNTTEILWQQYLEGDLRYSWLKLPKDRRWLVETVGYDESWSFIMKPEKGDEIRCHVSFGDRAQPVSEEYGRIWNDLQPDSLEEFIWLNEEDIIGLIKELSALMQPQEAATQAQ